MHGSGVLVAVTFSCARFAAVLQVLSDSMRVTVGNAFSFCIRALASIVVSAVVVAIIAVTFVVLVGHEGGDQRGDVCERNCSICRFCDRGKGWSYRFGFRDLESVEHGRNFSLYDLFNGIRTVVSVLLCRGILLTILAGDVEKSAKFGPCLDFFTSPLC